LPVPSRTSRTHCVAEGEASGRQASLEGGKTRNQVIHTSRRHRQFSDPGLFYRKGFLSSATFLAGFIRIPMRFQLRNTNGSRDDLGRSAESWGLWTIIRSLRLR
jgi:hypothetical protein